MEVRKKSILFYSNLESNAKIVVNQGGTSSGKTFSIIDLFFYLALTAQSQILTVVGQDIPNLKVGAQRDAEKIWAMYPEYHDFFIFNKTDRFFRCVNGSVIEFKSYEDEQDAKSGKRDFLFINEANGISYNIFWQLYIRTKNKCFIDYNPTAKFWVHDKLIGRDDVELLISDHRHNIYLTEEQHERIENIDDDELFRVYARGLTGNVRGLIFNNWDFVDEMPKSNEGKHFIGVDFGYTNDPTSILHVCKYNGELFVDEIQYKTGMLNNEIADELNKFDNLPKVADSAEPKSIDDLKTKRVRYLEPLDKRGNSIVAGIQILKQYKVHITRNSVNLKNELTKYKWKVDKNGNSTNEPIGIYNHAIDALRYVGLNFINKRQAVTTSKFGIVHRN